MTDIDKALATGNDYLDISSPAAEQFLTYADIITMAAVPHHDVTVGMSYADRSLQCIEDVAPIAALPINPTARSG